MKLSYSILVLITVFTFSNCIPTSVLANTKDPTDQENFKVKRSSNEKSIPVRQGNSENHVYNQITNDGLKSSSASSSSAAATGTFPINNNSKKLKSNQHHNEKLHLKSSGNDFAKETIPDPIVTGLLINSNIIKEKPAPHKRGVNSQFLYSNGNNNNGYELPSSLTRSYSNYMPNGVWNNELDPLTSMDFKDVDNYPRAQYISHNKPYDNLQNILNSEPIGSKYQGLIALPYEYNPSYGYNRYYNERRKRSNKQHSNFDDSIPDYTELELTPDELLALLAMIEAGGLEKSDLIWGDINNNNINYNKDYLPIISKSNNNNNYYDDHDEIGSFILPSNTKLDINDFDPRYQIPINFDNIPRYDIYKDNTAAIKGSRGGQLKRFMVSKKKRSLGHYLNEPIGISPSISFSPIKGAKSIQKVI